MTEDDFEKGFFTFKRFRVCQRQSSMKVGTDAVLLGAWMNLPDVPSPELLDIGTGTGVLSLFAAQRLSESVSDFRITALEPDVPSFTEACANFEASPWGAGLTALNVPLQEYAEDIAAGQMDMIFSNPPFFTESLKAPDPRRCSSRHTDTLSFEEIIRFSTHLLKMQGRLALVLPAAEGTRFISLARSFIEGDGRLVLTRICRVFPAEGKPVKRFLMEFTLLGQSGPIKPEPAEETLILQDGPKRSGTYGLLTRDFYVR